MNGDSGAAAAPATAPLDRDEASARPPGEGVKLDEPAALGEKQQGATMAMAAAATEQAPAATTNAPEATAAPAPPARNGGGPFSSTVFPRTVDAIAEDHFKRRDAILRAITDDQDALFAACDPARENLCLYGEPDGRTWTVAPPADEVPPEIPEPCLGINFARDGMRRSDWVSLVAVHSDAWLRSVAWYFGARLDKRGRAALFAKMNSRPSLYEVATGRSRSGTAQAKQARRAAAAAAEAAAAAAANGKGNNKANGGGSPPHAIPHATRQPGADPDAGVVLGAGGARAAAAPLATGRLITEADASDPRFTGALRGRRCELLWPDDGLWYLVEILEVDSGAATARARYSSGEEEVLSLREVAEKGELSLLAE